MTTAPLIAQAPWDDYAVRVADLYPPLGPGDGLDEAAVEAAESRLLHRFPRLLREFYLVAGRRSDLTRGATQPVGPEALEMTHEALIFAFGDDFFPTCA